MRLEDPVRPTRLSPLIAGEIVVGGLELSALVGRRNAPDASHPDNRSYNRSLDKPSFTPPGAVFRCGWPVLETSTAVGSYRLLRHAPSSEWNAVVGLSS